MSGDELPLLKLILKNVDLNDLKEIKLELVSESPLYSAAETVEESTDASEATEADAEPEPETTETDPEPESEDTQEFVTCSCGAEFKTDDDLVSHKRWCTDEPEPVAPPEIDPDQTPETETVEETDDEPETSDQSGIDKYADIPQDVQQSPTDVLTTADTDGQEVIDATGTDDEDEEPEPPEGLDFAIRRESIDRTFHDVEEPAKDYIDAIDANENPNPLNYVDRTIGIDTAAFHVLGTLYRGDKDYGAGELTELLDGTNWEIPRPSLYQYFYELHEHGLLDRQKQGNSTRYSLTQLGHDYVYVRVMQEPGYILALADKITGKHPTDKSLMGTA